MFDFVTLLACGLAVWRVARMIALEEGPVSVFLRLRARLSIKNNWISRGINCPLCVSFWLGWLAYAPFAGGWLNWIVGSLAVASVTVVMTRLGF